MSKSCTTSSIADVLDKDAKAGKAKKVEGRSGYR